MLSLHQAVLVSLGLGLTLLVERLAKAFWIRSRPYPNSIVPGPWTSSYLWGEEKELFTTTPGLLYTSWHKRYGGIVALRGCFGTPILSVIDPRAINFILGEATYVFPKPSGVREWFRATLGEGILWVEGKTTHEIHRRSLAPSLSQASIKHFKPIFFETSLLLVDRWIRIIDQQEAEETVIDVAEWAARFALDTIGRAALAHDFNCLAGEPSDLARALDGLTNNEHEPSSFYIRALFWVFPIVLSLGQKGRMIRKVKQELGRVAENALKETGLLNDSHSQTVLANLLRADDRLGIKASDAEIVSQMRTIISAAYEPISAIIAWALYELATHPVIQESLREAIQAYNSCGVASESDLNAAPGPKSIQDLPLLDAVLKETLRLHPPILENHHEASESIRIPLSKSLPGSADKDMVVAKGVLIVIPINVLHTHPDVWGPDAMEFRPDRWMIQTHLDKYNLMAFSAGPRSCLGRTFAMAEVKTLLMALLQRFSFRCTADIEAFQSFVIRPRVVGETRTSLPLVVKKL